MTGYHLRDHAPLGGVVVEVTEHRELLEAMRSGDRKWMLEVLERHIDVPVPGAPERAGTAESKA